MKRILSIIFSAIFFFNSLYLPSFALTYNDYSSDSLINDLFHKASMFFLFQASQGTALIHGDFVQILENDATYKELCENGAVSFDETTGNVSLSEEMQEYLIELFKLNRIQSSQVYIPKVDGYYEYPASCCELTRYCPFYDTFNYTKTIYSSFSSKFPMVVRLWDGINEHPDTYYKDKYIIGASFYYMDSSGEIHRLTNEHYTNNFCKDPMYYYYDSYTTHAYTSGSPSTTTGHGNPSYVFSEDMMYKLHTDDELNLTWDIDGLPAYSSYEEVVYALEHFDDLFTKKTDVEEPPVFTGDGYNDDGWNINGDFVVSKNKVEQFYEVYNQYITDGDKTMQEILDLLIEWEKNWEENNNDNNNDSDNSGSGSGDYSTILNKIYKSLQKIDTDLLGMTLDVSLDDISLDISKLEDKLNDISKKLGLITALLGLDAVANWIQLLEDLLNDFDNGIADLASTAATALSGTADLLNQKFPFCIPHDVFIMVSSFAHEPVAPVFNYDVNLDRFGIHETLTINLEDFEIISKASRGALTLVFGWFLTNLTFKVVQMKKEE